MRLLRTLKISDILYFRNNQIHSLRYAIGNVERPTLKHKIGWLDSLANDINEPYYANNTGGPSIKVSKLFMQINNKLQNSKFNIFQF